MERIVLGTGNEELDEMLKRDLEQAGIGQVVAKVATRKVLIKRVLETGATMVIAGEELVGDKNTGEEWFEVIEEIRGFSINIRIVFLCDRPTEDLFLTNLTTFSVYDIFHEGKLPQNYIKQLSGQPEFKNIEMFRKQLTKATDDLLRLQKEKEAEQLIRNGVLPKTGQVIDANVPIYERLLIPPQLIVIASAFEGAGSSTFGRMLAEYLASFRLHVGFLESPYARPSWFDFINASRLVQDGWSSWHRQIATGAEVSKGSDIQLKDVHYIVKHRSEQLDDLDFMKTAQIVGLARQIPILFYDLSSNIDDANEKIVLSQANHLLLVTSFDPVRVNREHPRYKKLLEMVPRDKISVICNRSSGELKQKHGDNMLRAYGVQHMYHLPMIPGMIEINMEGESFWDVHRNDELMGVPETFREIAEGLLGKEVFSKLSSQKKKGWFLRWKQRHTN